MLSLEDEVIMKLHSSRPKDYQDITNKAVLEQIDWELLQKIVDDGELDNSFYDRKYKLFIENYEKYKNNFKK